MNVVFAPIGGALAYLAGVRGPAIVLGTALLGIVAGLVVFRLSVAVARGGGATLLAFLQPSGRSSPYEQEYSAALALEARDDVEGAFAWFDAAIVRNPTEPRLRVALADLCVRQARHGRAEALYLETRRLVHHRDLELYCTQRVIELRLGPLKREAAALPELRRVMDRFPGTREAEGAGRALSRLKTELLVDG